MIRFLSRLSHSNTLRYTQYTTAVRLFSSKSDDSSIPVREPIEDEPETSSESSSPYAAEKSVDPKYSRSDDHASLVQLFDSLPSDPKHVSLPALLEFYDRIRNNHLITPAIKKHPKFGVFRDATEILLPDMHTHQLKNMFAAIAASKAVMHDKLGSNIVDALVKRITHLPFDQILFVDFLLNKCNKVSELSKSYSILRLTMHTMFLAKVEDELAEPKQYKEVMDILAYCENNSDIIPTKIVNSLATSLLLVDEDKFTVRDLTSVLIFLANFGKLNEHVEKLLRKVIELWYQLPVTANEVLVLFKVLAIKGDKIDRDIFKDTGFLQHCVNILIQENKKRISFNVQNKFNKIGFVNVDLIEHLSKFFELSDGRKDLTVVEYIIICNACARANYKPANWNSIILEALKTFKFDLYLTAFGNFDWAQFALNLDKLGYCDIQLIRTILNSKYLQKQKSYDPAKLNKLKTILEREGVSSSSSSDESDDESSSSDDTDDELPLYDDLKSMFGVNKIWPNVRIDSKLTIPYVLKMDLKTGDFLPFTEPPLAPHKDTNELLIGVIVISGENGKWDDRNKMSYAKKLSRRMERKGISSVLLEENKWNTLKNYEKSLVFYTKIVNLMEFYRKKQLNQLSRGF